jgi:hypothetical protein
MGTVFPFGNGSRTRPGPTTLEHLTADIARRLRPVVSGMPPAEFDALVRRMAELELKFCTATRGRPGRRSRPRGASHA